MSDYKATFCTSQTIGNTESSLKVWLRNNETRRCTKKSHAVHGRDCKMDSKHYVMLGSSTSLYLHLHEAFSIGVGVLSVVGRIARCRRWLTSWCPACIIRKCNGDGLSMRAATTPAHCRRTPASSRARTASACHWSIMTGG